MMSVVFLFARLCVRLLETMYVYTPVLFIEQLL